MTWLDYISAILYLKYSLCHIYLGHNTKIDIFSDKFVLSSGKLEKLVW